MRQGTNSGTGNPAEAVLIRRARDGDSTAMNALVEAHYKQAYNLAYHLSGNYDEANDILYIRLRDAPVLETDEVRPGLFADLDQEGRIVGFEILDARETVADPALVDLHKLPA